jgi:hypothetical protein
LRLPAAFRSNGQKRFGIGRTTSAGETLLDEVDVSPYYPGPVSFTVGNLNGKEQVSAWSVLLRPKDQQSLWIRSYDRLGSTQLPDRRRRPLDQRTKRDLPR